MLLCIKLNDIQHRNDFISKIKYTNLYLPKKCFNSTAPSKRRRKIPAINNPTAGLLWPRIWVTLKNYPNIGLLHFTQRLGNTKTTYIYIYIYIYMCIYTCIYIYVRAVTELDFSLPRWSSNKYRSLAVNRTTPPSKKNLTWSHLCKSASARCRATAHCSRSQISLITWRDALLPASRVEPTLTASARARRCTQPD